MNIKDYYEKKKELEYLITYNERIHMWQKRRLSKHGKQDDRNKQFEQIWLKNRRSPST